MGAPVAGRLVQTSDWTRSFLRLTVFHTPIHPLTHDSDVYPAGRVLAGCAFCSDAGRLRSGHRPGHQFRLDGAGQRQHLDEHRQLEPRRRPQRRQRHRHLHQQQPRLDQCQPRSGEHHPLQFCDRVRRAGVQLQFRGRECLSADPRQWRHHGVRRSHQRGGFVRDPLDPLALQERPRPSMWPTTARRCSSCRC